VLTPRGRWFLAAAGPTAVGGTLVLAGAAALVPLLGMAALGWFLARWAAFAWQVRQARGRLVVRRELRAGGRAVSSVWAYSNPVVRLTVELTAGSLPRVVLADRPPADLDGVEPDEHVGRLVAGSPVVIDTPVKPTAMGVLRFEGLAVRAFDPCGLFEARWFVRHVTEVPVLPPLLSAAGGKQRGVKRVNALPPPGLYRLRRPGGGGELLDLRDYRPGDPPKTIAWKASARRDRLITKEFESDVPVRVLLLLDASTGARVGPAGESAVARLAMVAAGVAQSAAAGRDLVGLAVCDEDGVELLSPARTAAHRVRVLRELARAAARLPHPAGVSAERLSKPAHALASEVYPDLLAADLNALPLGLFWRPALGRRIGWLVVGLFFLPFVALIPVVLERLARLANLFAPAGYGWAGLLGLLLLPWVFGGLVWFVHGVRGMLPPHRPQTARRKALAAVFAAADRSGPAMLQRYVEDDEAFADRAGRFLTAHRVRPPLALVGPDGEDLYRSPGKVAVLAGVLVRATAVARDNELYVIFADLAELTADELAPLLAAVRAARARHHAVAVMVPWPADVPADLPGIPHRVKLAGVVRYAQASRYHRQFAAVRTLLTAAGATLIRADAGDPVRRVLDKLDRVRGVGGRR
jgi:uncharacterized protein (DUF58 family)